MFILLTAVNVIIFVAKAQDLQVQCNSHSVLSERNGVADPERAALLPVHIPSFQRHARQTSSFLPQSSLRVTDRESNFALRRSPLGVVLRLLSTSVPAIRAAVLAVFATTSYQQSSDNRHNQSHEQFRTAITAVVEQIHLDERDSVIVEQYIRSLLYKAVDRLPEDMADPARCILFVVGQHLFIIIMASAIALPWVDVVPLLWVLLAVLQAFGDRWVVEVFVNRFRRNFSIETLSLFVTVLLSILQWQIVIKKPSAYSILLISFSATTLIIWDIRRLFFHFCT